GRGRYEVADVARATVGGEAGDGADRAKESCAAVDASSHRDRTHVRDQPSVDESADGPVRREELPELIEALGRRLVVEGGGFDDYGLLKVVLGQGAVVNGHGERDDCPRWLSACQSGL